MTSVIQRSSFFTSLPREYYFSPEIFEREMELVYGRQWLYFGHASQLQRAGDYVVRTLGGESVIATRDQDGEIHAFLNVCRHRGSRICDEPCGHVKRFICPYHRWSYDLDGTLMNAPTIPDGEYIEYGDWGLHQVHTDVWHGLIFVCVGDCPPDPISSWLDRAAPDATRIRPEAVKQAHVETYEMTANWKVLFENFMECYHCPGSHPEYCRTADVPLRLEAVAADGRPIAEQVGIHQYLIDSQPLRPGKKTLSIDGEFVSTKLLGEFGEGVEPPDGFGLGLLIQPAMSGFLFHADHGVMQEINPLSVDRVQFINRWFVHRDAEEGRHYDLDRLIELWDKTNRQDKTLCERVQAGLHSRRYVPGPISATAEIGMASGLATYLALMDRSSDGSDMTHLFG